MDNDEIPENIPANKIKPDPLQMTESQVTSWFVEIYSGRRNVEDAEVTMERVRPNPFAPMLDPQAVRGFRREIERGRHLDRLLVARLPDGNFVDVDTPHLCEAYRQAGRQVVPVGIVGEFTVEDCERIGLIS